jgi:hypothetical protein
MDPLPDHSSKSNKLNHILGTVPNGQHIFFNGHKKDQEGSRYILIRNQLPSESGTLYCFPVLRIRIRDVHISESLEKFFWVKILKFFVACADPGSGIFLTLDTGWKKFGSGINIPDPDHSMLQIRDVYPGPDFFPSRIRTVFIPDPGSWIRIKEFKYFNPKKMVSKL